MSFYEPFKKIKAEMRDLYLNTEQPLVLSSSFGKDSTLVLLLLWEMLLTIPKEKLTKKVYVVSSDTLVELEAMSSYISSSLEMVQEKADQLGLPIETRKVVPEMKDRFFFNILAKGNPPVVPSSKRFRWCTAKMKQSPINRIIREIQSTVNITMNQDYDLYMFLGTRDSESIQRKNSMNKYSENGSKFGRHSDHKRVRTYYPIRNINSDQLFGYLFDYEILPWGMPLEVLLQFYPENVMECGIKSDGQGFSCGGNGRSGCWTCTFVSEDKMLMNEIQKGYTAAYYLNAYKQILATIRNDIRYRIPIRRLELKKVNKRLLEKDNNPLQINMFEDDYEENITHEYQSFQRAEDINYSPGSLTFEARKLLLEHLLYTEQLTNLQLIDPEEIQAIIKQWQDEGYAIKYVYPKPFNYDGALVYDQHFDLNEKETTNPFPQFWITREFDLGRDEMIDYISKREQETGKSYYYNLNHWDFGEDEEFVYNMASFLVCEKDVHSLEEAAREIDKWLYPKAKGWNWNDYVKSTLLA